MESNQSTAGNDTSSDVEAFAAEALLRNEGSTAAEPACPAAPPTAAALSRPRDPGATPPRVRKIKIEYRARKRRFEWPSRVIISPGVAAAVLAMIVGGFWVAVGAAFGKNPLYGLAPLLAGVARLVAAVRGKPEP